ncbi:gluthatione ABC transport system ATP-binding protein GsiA [Clostridium aceticum]|uniref:Gluthatione ABC transport system ATP-binding protein GsiA n=1 Tax=Clostridium aceticum TaxID=84022 RepID=A0A0D8I7U9_9CLOT|nr:ABC transporter ATP-binding protein [Clostridium aceticum]AKL94305.1 gluthatione ABC transport system ATP-binding protein GsiA [Clostridium aceticum]KJF26149.1 ABC transporter ATP-binding protein [Clostridium aceticum]
MENKVLQVEDLAVCYSQGGIPAVKKASFAVEQGSTLGIIGESGSGKTTIAMAIMGLLEKNTAIEGKIYYKEIEISALSEKERNRYRWKNIAIVYQNHLDILNPVLTIYEQIAEGLRQHTNFVEKEIEKKIKELCLMVSLEERWLTHYPHQLSGGMRQKVLIAMALCCDPEVLIVDEPTTALDAATREEIIDLLYKLQKQKKITMLLISHDMYVIKRLSTRALVMYSGKILEEGFTKDVMENPLHTYTRGLLNASLDINPYQDLWGIPGEDIEDKKEGCVFYHRCIQKSEGCQFTAPTLEYTSLERRVACNRGGIITLLEGKNISKSYVYKNQVTNACKNCHIKIRSGEIVALIGQSGSGKTTLASILSGLLKEDAGEVFFEGKFVKGNNFTKIKNGIQMVFQDPFSATNESFTIEEIVREPLDILKLEKKEERKIKVKKVLEEVQLPISENFLQRQCSTLSGGQRQRLAIARSLIMEPKLLIADEISSMLDPSTKANVLRLLKGLQNTRGFAMLYITHDLMLARKIADEAYIMWQGEIIEKGNALKVFHRPESSYGKVLIEKELHKNIDSL